MSALTFSLLRSFCYGIEQDSQKLRKVVENKLSIEGDLEDAHAFVNELKSEVANLSTKTSMLESKIYDCEDNNDSKRLSYVGADEIVNRYEKLLKHNRSSLLMLKKHLQKYVYFL